MPYACSIPVRFGDCDLARIVYYPRYLHFCHVAMEELFRDVVGVSYDGIVLEEGVGYPSVRVTADYEKPLRYGDVVDLRVAVEHLGRSSVRFRFEGTRRGTGERSFVIRTTAVAVDMETWQSVPIPEHHRRGLETLREQEREQA